MPNTVWASDRLLYRAVEESDESFLETLNSIAIDYANSSPGLLVPQGSKSATKTREDLQGSLLGVIICLKSTTADPPTPVGFCALTGPEADEVHHRCADYGISIDSAYQGRGYGAEATRWCLNWAFKYANLNRVELGAFEYNPGAVRLYERLGFVLEGRKRKRFWYDGRYWDDLLYGMLREDWEKRYAAEAGGDESKTLMPVLDKAATATSP
ncbi:hypothetical protein ANO11243_016790 [Dothideomycetidae sp. 11243]|nr:hypothetical protein ANO11243_016790 [fungal sp. No.11243]